MAHFIDAVRSLADVVLFDSPPALAVADATLLSARVDGTLFVLAFGDTRKTAARQALEILSRARGNVLGTVMNKMDASSGGYYYGKYYYTPVTDIALRGTSDGNNNNDDNNTAALGNGNNGNKNGAGALPTGTSVAAADRTETGVQQSNRNSETFREEK